MGQGLDLLVAQVLGGGRHQAVVVGARTVAIILELLEIDGDIIEFLRRPSLKSFIWRWR
jgi:hypothetical protein